MYALGADLAALDGASDDDAPAVAAAEEPVAVRAVHAVLVAVGLLHDEARIRYRALGIGEPLTGTESTRLFRYDERTASEASGDRVICISYTTLIQPDVTPDSARTVHRLCWPEQRDLGRHGVTDTVGRNSVSHRDTLLAVFARVNG